MNRKRVNPTPPPVLRAGLATAATLVMVFAVPGRAQPRPDAPGSEEPIALTPFSVDASRDVGYLASSTLAGTRFNTPLKDTAASISVFTPEFLQDIGVTNTLETLGYGLNSTIDTTDMTGNGEQNNDIVLKIRGLSNASLGRNYFAWSNNSDVYNTERLTFSRGPNSVLFGVGGAGGIINTDTKRAFFENRDGVTARYGSWEDYRATLDLNRVLTRTLAVRANFVWQDKKGWRDFEFARRKGAALAATWRPFGRTEVRLDSEVMRLQQNKPLNWAPYDAISAWIAAGRPLAKPYNQALAGTDNQSTGSNNYFITNSGSLLHLNGTRIASVNQDVPNLAQTRQVLTDFSLVPRSAWVEGPGNTSASNFQSVGLFIDQEVTKDLFIQAAANVQHRFGKTPHPLGWNDYYLSVDASAVLPDGSPNPYAGQYFVQSNNIMEGNSNVWNTDYRVTASYKMDLGRWFGKHQLAAMISRRQDEDYSKSYILRNVGNPSVPGNLLDANDAVLYRTYVSFSGPNPLDLPNHVADPFVNPINVGGVVVGRVPQSANNNLTRIDSALIVAQSSWWGGRLVGTLGLRTDRQDVYSSTYIYAANGAVVGANRNRTPTTNSGHTETAGGVFHVTKWLGVAYNHSTNFSPQRGVQWSPDSQQKPVLLGNVRGIGDDIGLRFNLLQDRLYATVTYYKTSAENAQKIVKFRYAQGAQRIDNALRIPYLNTTQDWGQDVSDVVSQGTELELTANPTASWRLQLNAQRSIASETSIFPHQYQWLTDNAKLLADNAGVKVSGGQGTVGAEAAFMRGFLDDQAVMARQAGVNHLRWSWNMFTRYSFSMAPLRGLFVGAGTNVRGPQAIGLDANNKVVWGGSYYLVNAQLGYSRRIPGWQAPVRFQLNVDNALNNDKLLSTVSDGEELYRWRYLTPRSFSLTVATSF